MKSNIDELVAVLRNSTAGNLTWEFIPPYQGTTDDLRREISDALHSNLSVGEVMQCDSEESQNGDMIIRKVVLQIIDSSN